MRRTSAGNGFLKRGLLDALHCDLVFSDPLDEALDNLFARCRLTTAAVTRNYYRVGLFLRGNTLERPAGVASYRFTRGAIGTHKLTSSLASSSARRDRTPP